ncbi:hypothetical protein PC128_g4846 [Phytophthora cactorum]|nr:hypothetical protein PC120_g6665 [Phytophthora cactorum]KAG3200094.1 hypothetical protein PC128_g4846 [Phytophthora cactorum]KAG4060935.1 hypothetical protein PC123_g4187 [Phytophthora cactorum]
MLVMSVALPPMRQVTAVPSLLELAWLWLAAGSWWPRCSGLLWRDSRLRDVGWVSGVW